MNVNIVTFFSWFIFKLCSDFFSNYKNIKEFSLQSVLSRFNQFFEAAPQRFLSWRWSIISLFFAISVFMIYGMMTHFTMDMSLESWFQKDDPAKLSLDKFRKQFGSDDGIYLVYEAKDGDVFSEQSLDVLRKLHEELDRARIGFESDGKTELEPTSMLPRIEQIDSLYNARYQLADGDTLISNKLIAVNYPENDTAREQRRNIALGQENFKLSYFSKDYHYGGIILKTDFGVVPVVDELSEDSNNIDLLTEDDYEVDDALLVDMNLENESVEFQDMQMDEYLNFMTELRTISAKPAYQHFNFYFTGNAAMMEFALNNMKQSANLLGLMILAVIVLLWFLFKSWSAVIWPVLVIACSAFWAIGFMSWIGVTLSTMVSLSFMLILAVGTADCVHVMSAYILYRKEGLAHRPAMTNAYKKTGLPIFLTTITTMAGMSALMISDLPQIAIFGFNSALGVGVAFLFTIFLLPVLLDIWHPYKEDKNQENQENKPSSLQLFLNKIPGFVKPRSKLIVFIYMSIFIAFIYGATQVKVDTNLAELTKENSEIRVTYNIVDEYMMGGQNLEFMLDFAETDALKQPKVLQAIAGMQAYIEATYPEFVVKTFSLADFVKDTNQVMHEGQESFKRIPEDARLTAQLLYLFDSANARDRRSIVNDDYSQSHISIQLRNKGSYEYTNFFESVQLDLERNFAPLKQQYPNMVLSVTGGLSLMMELIDHISWAQIKSFGFALMIITILMIVSLSSLQAGLISMVPNLLPAFFTFGVMGLLGIPLDTDTLIIAPLIIGIAVDDTIHFIAHYRDAWFESGDVDAALHSTIKEVGQAVTFTTLVLAIGFSMLAFSDYLGLAKTGIFGSLAIVVALSSDLLLLPALIQWIKPDLGRKRYLEKQATEQTGDTRCN
ncbi:MAG: putative RND superfamily exporter protein [Oleiphilaceae bacterium]